MIITSAYFFGDLYIAQINQSSVVNKVNWFINKYEPEFFRELMGQTLYKAYKEGTEETNGTAKPENDIEQKWKDLRDGKEFTDRGGTVRYFNGIGKKTDSTFKQSPIANYVYYWILRSQSSITTGSGEAVLNTDSGENVPSIHKQVFAWNQMVEMNIMLCEFLLSNESDYPSFQDYIWRSDKNLLTTLPPF